MATPTFERLKALEVRINKSYYRCRNTELFFEMKSNAVLEERWCKMMVKLRGWDTYRYDDKGNDLTKQSWIDYCKTKGLSIGYNIVDVCA